MPSGILTVPAPHLPEVIKTIRVGLNYRITQHEMSYDDEVYKQLDKWCGDMENYLSTFHKKSNKGNGR